MAEINFFAEDKEIPDFLDLKKIEKGLIKIASNHQSRIEVLNYIFCSDEYLLDINKQYLDHDYYTDIITFPYQQGVVVEGDVFLSVDRITDNATSENVSLQEEYYRVISHGLLHLMGYKDKEDNDAIKMRLAEEESIKTISAIS